MNANENKDSTQNQAVFEGVKEAMLKEGVIPREVIEYSEEIQEKKRLEKMQKDLENITSPISSINNTIEAISKKYSALAPILTPIKIVIKKAGLPFEIIDLVLEYQINGDKGVIIKIGEKVIETIVFGAGISVAIAISTAIAGYFASMSIAGAMVGFVVFAGIAGLSIWISNQSREILHFIYEYIYLPTKETFSNLQNGLDYFFSGDWYADFIRMMIFSNTEGNKILEDKLRDKYGDDEVDEMDSFEKDYRMLLGR